MLYLRNECYGSIRQRKCLVIYKQAVLGQTEVCITAWGIYDIFINCISYQFKLWIYSALYDVMTTGSRRRLVTDRQPSLGQAGVGSGTEEVWTYTSTTIDTRWSLLHDCSRQRLAADAAPAHERQGKGEIISFCGTALCMSQQVTRHIFLSSCFFILFSVSI